MSAPTFTKPHRALTWLIIGCSSGFGLAITRYALAHGQRVIAISREPSRTPDLVAEVESHGGEWHSLNVDDSSTGEKLIEYLGSSGRHIDVLVNNAGSILFGAVEQLADDCGNKWKRCTLDPAGSSER